MLRIFIVLKETKKQIMKQLLTISGTNLKTRNQETIKIKSSNAFILNQKLNKVTKDIYIEKWHMTNKEWEAGNEGRNSGVYLSELIEELTNK